MCLSCEYHMMQSMQSWLSLLHDTNQKHEKQEEQEGTPFNAGGFASGAKRGPQWFLRGHDNCPPLRSDS